MITPKNILVFVGALLFGFGLAFGGMTKPEVILNFLTLQDLGLLVLMGAAVIISFFGVYISKHFMKKPLIGGKFNLKESILDKRTIIGAIIFGIGWGIAGICPGSAFASLGVGNYPILIGILGMFIGAYIQGRFMK